ncbi:MAG: hypothetical protein CMJ75_09890 [Planctomycetaceae bacterium]|nr:hypothetical protein [Planctomycetaceae bacterium]
MARAQQPREELLRDATALVERVALQVSYWTEPVVVGFRSNGAVSIYFGEDPVYQFNCDDELRRSHWKGQRIKAQQRQLKLLRQKPDSPRLQLSNTDLGTEQTNAFVDELAKRLELLRTAVFHRKLRVIGQVPEQPDLLPRLHNWLESLAAHPTIALTPSAQ